MYSLKEKFPMEVAGFLSPITSDTSRETFGSIYHNSDWHYSFSTKTRFYFTNYLHSSSSQHFISVQKCKYINLLSGIHGYSLIKQCSLAGDGGWYLSQQLLTAANVAQAARTHHASTVCLNITDIDSALTQPLKLKHKLPSLVLVPGTISVVK